MTYYGANDIAASFRTVRNNTLKIAEDIPEDKYDFRPAEGTRTVAQTLIHITHAPKLQEHVQGVAKLKTLEGFDFPGFIGRLIAEEQTSRSKAQIVSMLREEGDRFAGWMEGLSDDSLGERVQK